MEGRFVVFIRTSSSARVPIYQSLLEAGLRMLMVSPFRFPVVEPFFEHWLLHETSDVDLLDEAISTFVAEQGLPNPEAYLSFDEYGIYPAALLSERHGTRPVPLPAASIKQGNLKSEFRIWCAANNVRSPKSVLLTPTDDPVAVMQKLGITFPVICKPSPGAGSLLSKKLSSEDELTAAVADSWARLSVHKEAAYLRASLGREIGLMLEEYIGGQEVDLDCVIENGEVILAAISDNFEPPPPLCVEVGGCTPTRLPEGPQERLRDLLRTFVAAHGRDLHGVIHFEAKYDFDRADAFVIENNSRPGSAETCTMIETVYGVRLGDCVVQLALGLPLPELVRQAQSTPPEWFSASVNIFAPKKGPLRRVVLPACDEAFVCGMVQPGPGDLVAPAAISFKMIAWVVAKGRSPEEALNHIHRLTEATIVEVDDE